MTIDDDPTAMTWTAVADAAQKRGRVNVPVTDLAERTGLSLDAVEEALDTLAEMSMVATWDAGDGRVATLTPYAAAKLGLKLDGAEGRGGAVWRRIGARDRKDRHRPTRIHDATSVGVNLDDHPGNVARPDQIAEATEALEAFAAFIQPGKKLPDSAERKLPRPMVCLIGSQPWPIAWPGHEGYDGRCPACRDAPIGRNTICLVCHAWGFDWFLVKALTAQIRAAKQRPITQPKKTFAGRQSHSKASA